MAEKFTPKRKKLRKKDEKQKKQKRTLAYTLQTKTTEQQP